MALRLDTIKPKKGSRTARKRIGRGLGSTGTFSGRGVKGQRARSGGRSGLKLKGMRSILLSIPKKRGFKTNRPTPAVINVKDLSEAFTDGTTVTPELLVKKQVVTNASHGVKVLGDGEMTTKITLKGCRASKSAREKIEQAGGQVIS